MFPRRQTRQIKLGSVGIGSEYPITVQSMANTDTRDVIATVDQIKRLESAGCEIVRLAVVDLEAANALQKIKQSVTIPLIADIHFDYKLALAAIESGVDGLRLNPGNIGKRENVEKVVVAAKEKNIPIRIGVNSGSLEKEFQQLPMVEGMIQSALKHIKILESFSFFDIKVSLKSSSVPTTINAYRALAKEVDYPLHLGVTEAGTLHQGTIKSALGIGALLAEGIGDTVRVSLTEDPVEEVYLAYDLLNALEIRKKSVNFVSCPTCGRCQIDLITLAKKVEKSLKHVKKPITVAVMGCVVNGPGEASHADIGIAGGKDCGVIFKKGKPVKTVPQDALLDAFLEELQKLL